MTVLAFDISITGCSVCIYNNKIILKQTLECPKQQAELLMPYLDQSIKQIGLNWNDIKLIAINRGPIGSFTSIRTLLATAKGISLSLNIPIASFNTLEVFFLAYKDKINTNNKNIYTIMSGYQQQELYAQQFCITTQKPIGKAYIINNIDSELKTIKSHSIITNDNRLGINTYTYSVKLLAIYAKQCPSLNNLTPIYIRPPKINISTKHKNYLNNKI